MVIMEVNLSRHVVHGPGMGPRYLGAWGLALLGLLGEGEITHTNNCSPYNINYTLYSV